MSAGPGTILGQRYRLVKPLAAGGMGTVWLGHHVELETDVAIKMVDGPLARRPDLLERFRREARAAAQLKTPNVVQILDYGVDDGTPYIAMELLDGEDLDALLEREKTLSPARVAEILRPLCRALGMAHAAGIVHRDLKPANVFMARVAGEEVVKLVDFGIAKELNRGAEWSTGGSMVGSPLFMSPEQIDGSSTVDARTDVWSLAVMAYLMLFGEPPFHANGVAAILYKIAHEPYDPPSARSPGLAPLDAVFAKALARPLAERYPGVAELIAGFERAVAALDDPDLAVAPTSSVAARTGTIPMRTSEAPRPEAFDPPPDGSAAAVALPVPPGPPPLDRSSRADAAETSDALTLAAPSPTPAPLPGHISIPDPPRVAASRPPEPKSFPWSWILGGVVLGLAALAVVVAGTGDAPAPAASTFATLPPPPMPRLPAAPKKSKPAASDVASAAPVPDEVVSAAPSGVPAVEPEGEHVPPSASAPAAPRASSKPDASAAPKAAAPPASSSAPSAPPKSSAKSPPAKSPSVDPEWGVPVDH